MFASGDGADAGSMLAAVDEKNNAVGRRGAGWLLGAGWWYCRRLQRAARAQLLAVAAAALLSRAGARLLAGAQVVIINASGIIQMANKMAQQLFGYKKGELEGKNVSGAGPGAGLGWAGLALHACERSLLMMRCGLRAWSRRLPRCLLQVSVLMPQPFSGRHNGYLRNYFTTGARARLQQSVLSTRLQWPPSATRLPATHHKGPLSNPHHPRRQPN
jgi:hypothetical protein